MWSVGGGPDSLNEVKFRVGRTIVSACCPAARNTRILTERKLRVMREINIERIAQREVHVIVERRVGGRVKLGQPGWLSVS